MDRDRSQAMDHVVLVLFDNRSLDNLLGHRDLVDAIPR